jgi:hypothetical protein
VTIIDSREISYASPVRFSIRAAERDGEQVWLSARSLGAPGQLIWSNWRREGDRDRSIPSASPDQPALDLAAWLLAQSQRPGFSGADVRMLAQSLQALIGDGNEAGRAELASRNLLKNPNIDNGQMTGWTPVAATSDAWLGAEPRPGANGEWAAVIRSGTAGYHGGWCQTIAVKPGQEYLYLVQAETTLAGQSEASMLYWDYRRLRLFSYSAVGTVMRESAAWAPYWSVVKAPAGASSISVCPALLNDAGATRFSHAWFIPLEALMQ